MQLKSEVYSICFPSHLWVYSSTSVNIPALRCFQNIALFKHFWPAQHSNSVLANGMSLGCDYLFIYQWQVNFFLETCLKTLFLWFHFDTENNTLHL